MISKSFRVTWTLNFDAHMWQIEILELYARRFVSFRLSRTFVTDKSLRVTMLKLRFDYGH